MSVLLQCLECDRVENEFPSRDFSSDDGLVFECPNCGFEDALREGQTVADYAEEFGLEIRGPEVKR